MGSISFSVQLLLPKLIGTLSDEGECVDAEEREPWETERTRRSGHFGDGWNLLAAHRVGVGGAGRSLL